ncbi:hypothetical protein IMZ48_14545 [Candidatus Bathyarchaeota archaeon]|nr:hypothetical protein [Candidatus Bathyarchaeota archaeon]
MALQTTTTVIAAVTVGLTFASLIWWWTQHYMLYKRNHIHHRHAAREEAQKSRNASRSRSMANGTGTDMREPSITFQRPTYQRDPRDLQMELETIIDEVRARPGRLPVNFTMQELVEALEFQQEMAQPA